MSSPRGEGETDGSDALVDVVRGACDSGMEAGPERGRGVLGVGSATTEQLHRTINIGKAEQKYCARTCF